MNFDFHPRFNPVGDYLRQLGASSDVVRFVEAQPGDLHGKLANEIRTGRAQTVGELQAFIGALPQKREPEGHEKYVLQEAASTLPGRLTAKQFGKLLIWLSVQVVKHRTYRDASGGEYAGEWLHDPNWLDSPSHTADFFQGLRDWVVAEDIDIASYDLLQAREAALAWHDAQAKKGGGQVYDGSEIELYRFKDGWRIVRIISKNDLDVEGNRMGHCVGSYIDQVESGTSAILSLRDVRNHPHVTIEVVPDSPAGCTSGRGLRSVPAGRIDQIQGYGNSDPKPEYAHRLKEFFEKHKDRFYIQGEWDWSEVVGGVGTRELARDVCRYLEASDYDERYGFRVRRPWMDVEYAYNAIDHEYDARRLEGYPRGWYRAAEALGEAAYEADTDEYVREGGRAPEPPHTNFKWLEKKLGEAQSTYDEWAIDAVHDAIGPMPDEEDRKAHKKWLEAEREFNDANWREFWPGAFITDMLEAYSAAEKAGKKQAAR